MAKRILEIDAQGKKCQNGKVAIFLPNSYFSTFSPVHQNFFEPNDLSLSIMKDLIHTFSKKVSLTLSRSVHVLIRESKLNYFKFPHRISKFHLFWVTWMILKAWDVELEPVISFGVSTSEKHCV